MEAISTCGVKCSSTLIDLLRAFAITLWMPIDEDGMRTLLGGGAQRHGGVNPELAGFIGSRGDDAAFVALSADDDGFAFQRGIVKFFHGNEEGVHIDVEDGARKRGRWAMQPCVAENSSSGDGGRVRAIDVA